MAKDTETWLAENLKYHQDGLERYKAIKEKIDSSGVTKELFDFLLASEIIY